MDNRLSPQGSTSMSPPAEGAGQIDPTGIPYSLVCPVSHDLYIDPVRASDEHIYERAAILQVLHKPRPASPLTRANLSMQLHPCDALRQEAEAFRAQHPIALEPLCEGEQAVKQGLMFAGIAPFTAEGLARYMPAEGGIAERISACLNILVAPAAKQAQQAIAQARRLEAEARTAAARAAAVRATDAQVAAALRAATPTSSEAQPSVPAAAAPTWSSTYSTPGHSWTSYRSS